MGVKSNIRLIIRYLLFFNRSNIPRRLFYYKIEDIIGISTTVSSLTRSIAQNRLWNALPISLRTIS